VGVAACRGVTATHHAAISVYGVGMAVKKVTVTLPEELVEALGSAAREDGIPLSRLVASAAESELRRRVGRRLVADWQAEHGAFTVEEIAAARAEMAAADAQAFDIAGPGAA
jgi:post-segregation antitoxin (ccd killing protein)